MITWLPSHALLWVLLAANTLIALALVRSPAAPDTGSRRDAEEVGSAPGQPGTPAATAAANPWMPWIDPGPLPPAPDRGRILAVIPTAGRDPEGLRRCLDTLYRAARGGGRRIAVRPIVVLCPATSDTEAAVRRVCRRRAEVIALPGPFRYPRSVNAGLLQRAPEDGYALLLNDDCFFDTAGGLLRMKQSLREHRWACVGPWLRGESTAHMEPYRRQGVRRINEPIVGACALWDFTWLDCVGLYDERFGEGYGHDESDQHVQALRRGAIWGREERVIALHEEHTTFGKDAVRPETEFYQRNVENWIRKWGDIGRWGEGVEWQPLPGVHVAIAGHNVAEWLPRCLASVEEALEGFRWILTYADDASTDGSFEIARRHLTGADYCVVGRFPKASGAGQAKNRAIELGRQFQPAYPALILMDADDEMTPERVRHLLWRARDAGHRVAHGAYEVVEPGGPDDGKQFGPTPSQQEESWLSPCTTVIHWSLVPPDGRLFCEELRAMEDAELFLRWHLQGIHSAPLPGPVVHRYHYRRGSVMRDAESERHFQAWQERRRALLAA